MLTKEAFNALLKTLEEPPENVIFILATTEVHKVLDTIKSRCQRFDFRRITTDDIVKHLRWISEQEKIKISDDALFAIAKNSAGGMRDSISLLDQLSLLGITKEITTDDVNSILGRISFDTLFKLTEKIINSASAEAVQFLNEIYNAGNEPLQILTNLSEYFKNLLIAKNCSKELLPELTGLNEPQIKEITSQADTLETQQIVFLIERISYYIKEVKFASNQHLWLEVGIIDLSNMTENSTLLDLQNRIARLEGGEFVQKQHQINPAVTRPAPIQPEVKNDKISGEAKTTETAENNVPTGEKEDEFTPPPMSKKIDSNDINILWAELLNNIQDFSTRGQMKQLATPVQISKDGVILTFKTEIWVNSVNTPEKKQLIADAADSMLGQKNTKVTIRLAGTEDKQTEVTPVKDDLKKNVIETDEVEEEITSDITAAQENAKQKIERIESDQERMVMQLFDGKYVE